MGSIFSYTTYISSISMCFHKYTVWSKIFYLFVPVSYRTLIEKKRQTKRKSTFYFKPVYYDYVHDDIVCKAKQVMITINIILVQSTTWNILLTLASKIRAAY